MLKMGVIGAGLVFQNAHAKAYESRDDVEITAIAEPVPSYREAMAARFPGAKAHDDYRAVLDDPGVQAVDICLPHHLHEEAVLAAFDAGKDVLLEKPIAVTLDSADRMIAAARASGRQFYVALNQRFYPGHRQVKDILESGEYGRPFFAVAHVFGNEFPRMNDPANWKGEWTRAGGGALADSGTHVIDLLLWWFGRPKSVSCQWGRFLVQPENKGDDNVAVILGYDGMIADVAVSYTVQSEPWRESKWLYLEKASLQLHFDPKQPVLIAREGQAPEPLPCTGMASWWDGSVGAGIGHWLDCFLGKTTPAFGPEAARETLEIIEFAYQAAKTGKTLQIPAATACQ